MEKVSRRVSKCNIVLPIIAITIAIILPSESIQREDNVVLDFKETVYSPLIAKTIEKYEKSIEQKWINEQVAMKEEADRAREKNVKSQAKKIKATVKVVSSKAYSKEDLYWLSRVVSSEAKGESVRGQIAVANVVLNRVNSGKFKDTIKGVVFQKKQFSGVSDKSIYKEPTKEAVESAKKALEGERVVDDRVYYFYNPKTATSRWLDSRRVAVDIGGHRFTY